VSDGGPDGGSTPKPPAEGSPSPAAGESIEAEAEGEAEAVATEAPAKRKKKRKRRAEDEAVPAAEAAALDERVPAFARAWPQDPALAALVTAFEAGDYARVRRGAPALAKQTEDPAVRRAARELRRRLDPDPVAVYMLMAAAALLVFLAGWYWLHPHDGGAPHTVVPAGPVQ
jgi:hypothetical protein